MIPGLKQREGRRHVVQIHGAVDRHVGQLPVLGKFLSGQEALLRGEVVEGSRLLAADIVRLGDGNNLKLLGMAPGVGGIEQRAMPCPDDGGGAGVNANITGEGLRMTLNVLNPVGSVQTGYHGTMAMLDNSGYGEGGYIGGIHQANSSIAGISFYMSTQTIARHTIKVYGMVDS